ncbi:MAG: ion transporter [Lachnospiraceae bacterium]|nr:ion transporter [Lachnospiraceae bacterium]
MNKEKKSIKERIFRIIQIGQDGDVPSILFDIMISVMVFISVGITIAQTFEEVRPYYHLLFQVDAVIVAIFGVEYLLRIWTANLLYPKEKSWFRSVFKFVFSFYGIIDLLTILTFFLPYELSQGIVVLRILRVVRIMRLFKLNSTYDAFNVITDVLKSKRSQIISSMVMILILMLAASLCMYGLEHEAQPEAFDNAFAGIWWSVSALLTVGYGDIYPITIGGRIAAILISFLGVGMVAIPTGIISAGFVSRYSEVEARNRQNSSRNFVKVTATEEQYGNVALENLDLPTGLYVQAIVRGGELLEVKAGEIILPGDQLMLCSNIPG